MCVHTEAHIHITHMYKYTSSSYFNFIVSNKGDTKKVSDFGVFVSNVSIHSTVFHYDLFCTYIIILVLITLPMDIPLLPCCSPDPVVSPSVPNIVCFLSFVKYRFSCKYNSRKGTMRQEE